MFNQDCMKDTVCINNKLCKELGYWTLHCKQRNVKSRLYLQEIKRNANIKHRNYKMTYFFYHPLITGFLLGCVGVFRRTLKIMDYRLVIIIFTIYLTEGISMININ